VPYQEKCYDMTLARWHREGGGNSEIRTIVKLRTPKKTKKAKLRKGGMEMYKKRAARWLLGLLFSGVLVSILGIGVVAASATSIPKYGGTLTVALTGTVETMDPQKSVMAPVWRSVLFTVWEPLVRYVGGEQMYKPLLAESWEFTDSQTLVFHLRRGVKFHDGSEFDAEDVKFTIERMQDPETACPNAAFVEMIDEVIPVDRYTVQLRLSEPYGGILTNLDYVVMLSKESPPSPDSPPIGTGPFRFVEWVPGDHLTLERFPDYWQEGLPYLDRLIFKPIPDEQTRIANLEADVVQFLPEITPEQIPRIQQNKDLKIIEGSPGTMLRVLIFVTDVPPMDNLLVRRAVAHAIDREGFVEAVLYGIGTPSENIYSPTNPYCNPNTAHAHPYDLETARRLFEEAGYPEQFPEEAYPLRVTVPAGNTVLEKAAVLLQSSLRKIGIECKIEKYDVPTWLRLRESRPMLITYYSYAGVDPSIILSTNLLSPEKNLSHYYNDQLTQLMEEARKTVDFETRKQMYYRIQEIIADEVPFSVIASLPQVGAARSYVEGLWLLPSWSVPIYHEVWLNKG